jgi:hypothetical protein
MASCQTQSPCGTLNRFLIAFERNTPIEVADRKRRVELNRPVFPDSVLTAIQVTQRITPIVVHERIFRIELDRLLEFLYRVQIAVELCKTFPNFYKRAHFSDRARLTFDTSRSPPYEA